MFARADVAELVDAQVSEACCREAVEVRFFSSAPNFWRRCKTFQQVGNKVKGRTGQCAVRPFLISSNRRLRKSSAPRAGGRVSTAASSGPDCQCWSPV